MTRSLPVVRLLSLFVAACFASTVGLSPVAFAQEASGEGRAVEYVPVPLQAWTGLPVFDAGRIKPLDSYANQMIERIIGTDKTKIKLGLADRLDLKAQDFVAGGRETFELAGESRTFTPGELVKSWILESEAWRDVPVIHVPEGELLTQLGGDSSPYVSPAALEAKASPELKAAFAKLEKEGPDAEGIAADVRALYERRATFRRWAVDAAKHREAWAAAFEIFPTDQNVELTPEEIVLSWLVEPERWEVVPFLPATHFTLRQRLGVPEKNDRNVNQKFVSPLDVATSEGLVRYFAERRERMQQERMNFEETGDDERIVALLGVYAAFREISLDPTMPLQHGPIALPGNRGKFVATLNEAVELMQKQNARRGTMLESLGQLARLVPDGPFNEQFVSFSRAFADVLAVHERLRAQSDAVVMQGVSAPEALEEYPVAMADAEAATIGFRKATDRLAAFLTRQKNEVYQSDTASQVKPIFRELAAKSSDLKRLGRELEKSLYEQTQAVRVMPDLDPYALAKDRDVNVRNVPWLSLQALLHGDGLLQDFPDAALAGARSDWRTLADAYRDRSDPQRAERFAKAVSDFRERLAALGRGVESRRIDLVKSTLPADSIDQSLIDYTRYPQQTETLDLEVHYNELRPFGWSFVISLVALAAFALAFGKLRPPLFWTGVALLVFLAIWTAYGFYLRVSITGWAPVTNMYETIVFVPWVVCVLGLWFLALPITGPGLRDAWRMTALPLTWEESALSPEQQRRISPGAWKAATWLFAIPRVALMGLVLYVLAFAAYSDGGRPIISLLPTVQEGIVGESGAATVRWASNLNDWFVYILGIVCLAAAVWFVPRVLLTGLFSLFLVPYDLYVERGLFGRRIRETMTRFPFALGAAGACTFFFSIAAFAPGIDENFSPLQPVLRSNYWLTIHVLTIVASYGAGMLAWALGLIALGYYLFGRYERIGAKPTGVALVGGGTASMSGSGTPRATDGDDAAQEALARSYDDAQEGFVHVRAPEACRTLATYCYRAIQIACVLLAAGTILGGLWADVSWGRFWGWDPKEVWALISFLVYIAILHGRFAGYFNSFGLVFGTIIGASMIAMSWYGVNFALPQLAGGSVGLHSYGEGSGGLMVVSIFIILNWIFLFAAGFRYLIETASNRKPVERTATTEDFGTAVASTHPS
ncbi:MAG TPA: cytochrome c biogenesis protein CcsA [Pirellulaceae bacterium]|jgi:ABC-type transport system involved in cytochrome c biogenesis permease subunit|nr:cytochrome c biogenesis protein CcsA [Pirellulaceae bacterium]